jgi:hypothetical protein
MLPRGIWLMRPSGKWRFGPVYAEVENDWVDANWAAVADHCSAGPDRVTTWFHRSEPRGHMIIDRKLQREMLEEMREGYPQWVCYAPAFDDEQRIAANLQYLSEHGLCESGVEIGGDGHLHFGNSTIAAAGLDFLADDGGLSAILSVASVKLHSDTIRDLIAATIEAAPIP